MATKRDRELASKAKKHGANFSLRIKIEADRQKLPYSLALALFEKESNFTNVFGHDPVKPPQIRGGKVTKAKYLRYKKLRKAGYGMQGVGPGQLTWYEYQDRADKLGGAWKTENNIRVTLEVLSKLIKEKGRFNGVKAYNGSGPAAYLYAVDVLRRQRKWHKRLK